MQVQDRQWSSLKRIFWMRMLTRERCSTLRKKRKRRTLLTSIRLTWQICSRVRQKRNPWRPNDHLKMTESKSTPRLILSTQQRQMLMARRKKSQDLWPHLCQSLRMMTWHQLAKVRPLFWGRSKELPTMRTIRMLTKRTIQIRTFKGHKLESSQSKMVEPKILRMPMKKTRHPWMTLALRSSNKLSPWMKQRARKRRESARRTERMRSTEQFVWLRTHGRFCRQIQVFWP